MLNAATEAFVFWLGALFGSFFALCVHRIPRELSIVHPPSRCEDCKTEIPWYKNVPLFSYVFLRGTCSECGAPIGIRNWLIEIGSGLAALLLWWRYGLPGEELLALPGPDLARALWPFLAAFSLYGAVAVAGLIDLETMYLPNAITLPGIPLGVVISQAMPWQSWPNALLGAAVGALSFALLRWLYARSTGREGVGLGDVYLMGTLGGFLGMQQLPLLLLLASTQGAVVGLFAAFWSRRRAQSEAQNAEEEEAGSVRHYAIPFGAFLGLAAVEVLLVGQEALAWYSGGL
jgi:leader peptidase (prepilin peptidase)/N-methyltransferase